MEVTYELTQRDFFDSLIAHRNRNAFAKWGLRLLLSIVFLFAGLGLISLAVVPNKAQAFSGFAPPFALAAMWAAVIWAAPWWAARKQFSKQPSAHGPKTVLVDAVGVHWRWDGGSADVEWKNFIRLLESKNQFLLYTSPVCFNIVPKRSQKSEELSEFRALVAQNILRQ
jgi:hypothetical protein